MNLMIIRKVSKLLAAIALIASHNLNAETKGLLQLSLVNADSTKSYQNWGVGLYRYDDKYDGVVLSQALLQSRFELGTDWSAHAVLNLHRDPEFTLGFTQAYLQYQPLINSDYKWHLKLGGFYPAMSLENPDIGWISPYNYTNSAINSWLGEEIRIFGAEASISRPGRRFDSPHSFELFAASFKGNDPAGSLLSWRGFAMHDRQTTFRENVAFARVNSLNYPPLNRQAAQVLPFKEIDDRFGYYVGAHWDYLKRSQFRLYYYDNNGDPSAFDWEIGQYAWDTKFTSLAWLYKFTPATRVIVQAMSGKTAMGRTRAVDNGFYSYFVMLSHYQNQHRLSLRYDNFKVTDNDTLTIDPNASHGNGLTASWRYSLNKNVQFGAEVSLIKSSAANRNAIDYPTDINQQQYMVTSQLRF